MLGEKIKELRKRNHLTQTQLAEMLNNKFNIKADRAIISKWESGYQIPVLYTVKCLASIFGVTIDYLNSEATDEKNDMSSIPFGFQPLPKMKKVPRLGAISCGEPLMTEENFEGYDSVPENISCDFTLKCEGDSMIGARILDGDIVYIKQQPIVESGEIAAVLVDGDEKLLKRVYITQSSITLQAENPKYPPLVFVAEDMNRVSIIGKAVGFYSHIR